MQTPALRGACAYRVWAYEVKDALAATNPAMRRDARGQASLRTRMNEGRQIITF